MPLSLTDAVKTCLRNTVKMVVTTAQPLYHDAAFCAVRIAAGLFVGVSSQIIFWTHEQVN